jgi:hypothetical protein
MEKVYLYKYVISNEVYYFGVRLDGKMGLMRSVNEFSLAYTHMLYEGDHGDFIPISHNCTNTSYKFIKKAIEDIISNGIEDICDIYSDAIFLYRDVRVIRVNIVYKHEDDK